MYNQTTRQATTTKLRPTIRLPVKACVATKPTTRAVASGSIESGGDTGMRLFAGKICCDMREGVFCECGKVLASLMVSKDLQIRNLYDENHPLSSDCYTISTDFCLFKSDKRKFHKV